MPLADLLKPRTRAQILSRMLGVLSIDYPGHSLTNYTPGDPQRTLLELPAEGIADAERLIAAVAAGGYLDTASGEWLSELAYSQYGLLRQDSVIAQGYLTFTALPGNGPYELEAGAVWASTPSGAVRFVTLAGATVPVGGTVQVLAQAESPGSVSNVTANSLTVLNTPQPGLSVTNAPDWLVLAGADAESDLSLRQRCRLRWAERGGGATRGAYEFWALSSTPSVDKVAVLDQHPRGQGTVDVVLWGTGGLGPVPVALADAYIQDRRPVTADVQVYAATPRVLAFSLQLYAPGADRTRIAGEIIANLSALQQATPIGGSVYLAEIIEAAMLPAGMLDVVTTTAPQYLHLAPTEALILQPTLTWRDFA